MKALDDIAKEAAMQFIFIHRGDVNQSNTEITKMVRSAIDEALEYALMREPSVKMRFIGNLTLSDQVGRNMQSATDIYRAMTAELLAELKNKP